MYDSMRVLARGRGDQNTTVNDNRGGPSKKNLNQYDIPYGQPLCSFNIHILMTTLKSFMMKILTSFFLRNIA